MRKHKIFKGPKPLTKGVKHIPMKTTAIDNKLLLGQASEITPFANPDLSHPHYQALTDNERGIFRLKLMGMRLSEIEEATGKKMHDLSRIIKSVKAKFEFLARVWMLLREDPALKTKFFCLTNCPKPPPKPPRARKRQRDISTDPIQLRIPCLAGDCPQALFLIARNLFLEAGKVTKS